MRDWRWQSRLHAEISKPDRKRAKLCQRGLSGGRSKVRIAKEIQHLLEAFLCRGQVIAIKCRLRVLILSLDDGWQHASPDISEQRAHTGRELGLSGMVGRGHHYDGLDGALAFRRASERNQTESTVLVDETAVLGTAVGRAHAIQQRQRVFVRGRHIEIPGRR